MDDWNEIKTAFEVARRGTLSGAATALGVHRATVVRHVDSLEEKLDTRLFVRHAQGYSLTDAGTELFRVAGGVEEALHGFLAHSKRLASKLDGALTITSVDEVTPWLTPAMLSFQKAHTDVRVRYIASPRVFCLEVVEAHVAVRMGPKPQDLDHVVRPFFTMRFGLYAHRDYVERHGRPDSEAALADHRFVGSDDPDVREPFDRWLLEQVPPERIVFHSAHQRTRAAAICAGVGLGFLLTDYAEARDELVELMAPRPEWEVPVWVVTHTDLHRTPKVKAFIDHLRELPPPVL
ncbi:MAG: LysR family transcriptional regulator [Myxococcota bacterium]